MRACIAVIVMCIVMIWANPGWSAGQVDIVAKAKKSCERDELVLAPESIHIVAWMCVPAGLLHNYKSNWPPMIPRYLALSRKEAITWCRVVYRGNLLEFNPVFNLLICEDRQGEVWKKHQA